MSAQRVEHVVNLAKGWVDGGVTPALVILVARRGVIVAHEAFGRLTPEPHSPSLECDTIFPLTFLTKPLTATAAMILVEDGSLGLNRPVSEYIPEFVGEGKDAVMVHHLLTHTSGFRDEDVEAYTEKKKGSVEIPPPDETQHPQINEYLFLGYDAPLWKPPGSEMSYSNYGYNLLGEIVRRVSRRSLADLTRERIFEPLGMEDTDYIVPDAVRHRIVRRLADTPHAWLNNREVQETPWSSWGAFSTAMDMAILGQMFLNRGIYGDTLILSPASVAAMTRNQIPGIGAQFMGAFHPEASWGFGWDIEGTTNSQYYNGTLYSLNAFGHGGVGAVRLWVDPVYEIVGVYFSASLEPFPAHYTPSDLFINAVTAAVVDV